MNPISTPNIIENTLKNSVELRAVSKKYQLETAHNHTQTRAVNALNAVDLSVPKGEFLAIVGRSGCGKSTLLNILGGLDRPDSGQVTVAGRDLARFNETDFTSYRRDITGIIFQFFNLLPLLTVLENVALPALLAKKPRREVLERAEHLLQSVGLGERLHQQAALLSGGEMQRVAVARALINDPQIVLADEPTGNLDSQSAQIVLQALRDLTRENRHTVVMVTHSREAANVADTIREMRDGRFI